jgi:hypothetical protein
MKLNDKNLLTHIAARHNRPAVALVLTLIVLVVLTTVVYALSARLAAFKHRQQYLIDYQNARYASDSAVKYALATIQEIDLKLIPRPDDPDFSDLFTMDQAEYETFLSDWAMQIAQEQAQEEISSQSTTLPTPSDDMGNMLETLTQSGDLQTTDPNTSVEEQLQTLTEQYYYLPDPNTITVPGPYGPTWPLVTETAEFQVGQSNVAISIEDENAKMPLTWALTKDINIDSQAQAALETFCEWMQMDTSEINDLLTQLDDIKQKKQFTLNPKKSTATTTKTSPTTTSSTARSRRTARTKRTSSSRSTKKTRAPMANTTDFARLFHSAMLDSEKLAWALPNTGPRAEAPLKYLALWGSDKVNINTAPRHVLEAAFTFGGKEREIADEIIKIRKEKPFKSVDELRNQLYQYTDSIEKVKPYITTVSNFLTIKVTARSGNAKASAVAAVVKTGKKIDKIAVISF